LKYAALDFGYKTQHMHFIDPHRSESISFFSMFGCIAKNYPLALQMIRREVVGRYKGSVMGLAWSFLNPILMLLVYTFVFSVVFNARWGEGVSDGRADFALLVFIGMIVQGLFTEAINRAPSLIINNVNYVKKVVFPLEILPVISLGTAIFHSLISMIVMALAFLLINGYLHWTIIFVPMILLPLLIFVLGISWILASLGVFIRDVGQTIGIVTTILMFMSPVFYPVSALPAKLQKWMMLNPLTFIIEQARAVTVLGKYPDWVGLSCYSLIAMATCWLGYIWFQKTRKGFADVL
jgi:lipopolysaccharide transport system permease protein